MPARLRLAAPCSAEELLVRDRSAKESTERTHFQVLHRLSQRWRTEDIAEAVGYSVVWIRVLVKRYNEGGAEARGDRRWYNAGQACLLDREGEAALKEALKQKPADEGLWSGPQVAAWMSKRLARPVHPQRGWEVLRRPGYTPQRPRPSHEGGDKDAQESFPAKSARDPGG